MPFCEKCKAMVYPTGGKLVCRKCGHVGGAAESRVVRHEVASKDRVVLEKDTGDVRQQQSITCPKCGHDKAFFHLMQTRKSDEPPTQINECVKCHHSWREY